MDTYVSQSNLILITYVIELRQNFIQFYNFKTKLSEEELKNSGYKSAQDYELSRRNRAKHLMVVLNLIHTTAEFISEETGSDFIKEGIASLEIIDVAKMHELSGFDKIILIDIMCGTQQISV